MADLKAGELADVLQTLLAEASPELFGGAQPAIATVLVGESLVFASGPRDDPMGARRESRQESLALQTPQVLGPYRLMTPPAPGHRVVRVLVNDAVAFTLHDDEVDWDAAADGRSFTLRPRPYRSLAGATHVQIVYGVDAAVASLLGTGKVTVALSGSAPLVRRARGLAIAVLVLDADLLLANVRVTGQEGDYAMLQRLTALAVTGAETVPTSGDGASCRLTVDLTVQLGVRRALREGEGAPITRIATPGSSSAGAVAVEPELDV